MTPDGWTRLFFGDVRKEHKRLRDAVAHQPQHMSVAGINKSMWRLLQIQLESQGEYIMMAQIHDSIIFQAVEEKFDYYMNLTKMNMDTVEAIHSRSVNIPLESSSGTHWNPMTEWEEAA